MPQNNCNCFYCGKRFYRNPAHIKRYGCKLSFCSQKHFGLSYRTGKSKKQLKEEKQLYDVEYRRINKKHIKATHKTYNESPNGRAMQKRNRDKFKNYHLEYCRTPEYRRWKKASDEIYRAKKFFGEWWECMILVKKIKSEVCRLVPEPYERAKMRGTIAKMMRKKAYKRHLIYGWNY